MFLLLAGLGMGGFAAAGGEEFVPSPTVGESEVAKRAGSHTYRESIYAGKPGGWNADDDE